MIIWFTEYLVLKNYSSKLHKFLKNKNILHIDGDIFRKLFANDLKYI